MSRPAFTLIELLVVITIIVVLLALLTPAVDKAMYQAELAVCETNLHGIGNGGIVYTQDFKRHYPHRPGHSNGGGNQQARIKNTDSRLPYDDRPTIDKHIALKFLSCPLTAKVDFGYEANASNTEIFSTYSLWFGLQFGPGNIRYRGMFRLGDRFEWVEGVQSFLFNVLATDRDHVQPSPTQATSTHPDYTGVLTNSSGQNVPGGTADIQFLTFSWWSAGNYQRGPVDFNYTFDDGSTQRRDRVTYQDPRLTKVPNWANAMSAGTAQAWTQLPEAGR